MLAPSQTSLERNHLAAAPHLIPSSGARLLLLFAQSVLEPGVVPKNSLASMKPASTAQPLPISRMSYFPHQDPLVAAAAAPSYPETGHVAFLCTALLIVKAAALLDIGDTIADRHSNTNMSWQTAEFFIGSKRDETVALQETELGAYATRSAKEAEHLAVLLVQMLLQGMSQYLSLVVSLHRAETCCKLLDGLLAMNQQGLSQPLSNVGAAEIAHQSEFLVQSISQFIIPNPASEKLFCLFVMKTYPVQAATGCGVPTAMHKHFL